MSVASTQKVIEGYLGGHGAEWLSERIEFFDQSQSTPHVGRADVVAWLDGFYRSAFSDAHAEPVSLTVGDDRAAAEWVFRGRHTGSLAGEDPTGREVRVPMAAVYEVAGGEIVRARLYYDTGTLAAQISSDRSATAGSSVASGFEGGQ